MTPERAKALEAVATIVQRMRKRADAGEWHGGKVFDVWAELRPLLNALFALPAEPADAGEMVEVRACVALQPDGRWNWIGFGNALGPANDETLAEYALDFGAGNAKVAAFTTARIPRPVVPEVRAEVET